MPFPDIGRVTQAAIYRAGTFGRRPRVPTDGQALEEAARRVDVPPRVRLRGRLRRRRERRPAANLAAFDRWRVVPRLLVDTSERDSASSCSAGATPARSSPPRSACSRAPTPTPTSPSPAARGSRASPRSSAPRRRCRWSEVADELEGSGHWYQLYWSRDDDLVESLVHRAEACGSEAIVVTLDTAYLGWRPRDLDLGHLPFARGEGIAQYTSDPVFQRLVAERVPAAQAAGRRGRGAAAPAHPCRGAHAWSR